jgi:hypothetical protein
VWSWRPWGSVLRVRDLGRTMSGWAKGETGRGRQLTAALLFALLKIKTFHDPLSPAFFGPVAINRLFGGFIADRLSYEFEDYG